MSPNAASANSGLAASATTAEVQFAPASATPNAIPTAAPSNATGLNAINGQPEYLSSTQLKPVTSIQIVIQAANGTSTTYNLPLNALNGQYLSSAITLPTGVYKITQFLLLNGTQAVYGTPALAGKYAKLVKKPLPTSFTLTAASTTVAIVSPEVIEIPTDAVPADFGASAFTLNPIAFRAFQISAYIPSGNTNQNMIPTLAHLKVTSGTGTVYEADITAATNTITMLRQAAGYRFIISKLGYPTKQIDVSETQIQNYASLPLIVLLNKVPSVIPDTGVVMCYDTNGLLPTSCSGVSAMTLNSSQDGMIGRDADSATNSNTDGKLGFSYSIVPILSGGTYGITDCVKDNVTGLIWEGKKTSDKRAGTNTYTNYDDKRAGSTSEYVQYVNSISLCGFTDWRMPTFNELMWLSDYGNISATPNIDSTWFPNTASGFYWAANTLFSFDMYSGQAGNTDNPTSIPNNKLNYVRLVRGSAPIKNTYLTIINNGTEVLDSNTGLIWQRCNMGSTWNGSACIAGTSDTFTHPEALAYAETQKEWRMPNIKELASLCADRESGWFNSCLSYTTRMALPDNADSYWSSTAHARNTRWWWGLRSDYVPAWFLNFGDGLPAGDAVDNFDGRLTKRYVRLVRNSQ